MGRRTRWPLRRVLVSGPSMVPTLRHGDVVVAHRTGRIRPGDVVLGRFGDLPDRLVIKRAVHETDDGGWWLESDNGFAGGDSRTHGAGEVEARAVWVLPQGRLRRMRRITRRITGMP